MTYRDAIKFFWRYGGTGADYIALFNSEPTVEYLVRCAIFAIVVKGKHPDKAYDAMHTILDYHQFKKGVWSDSTDVPSELA